MNVKSFQMSAARGPWWHAVRPVLVLAILSCFVLIATAENGGTTKAAVSDPVGDTLGTGATRVDATYFAARTTEELLIIDLAFAGPVAPPASGADNALVGFIDLDVDADAMTGGTAFVDFLTTTESRTGSEFYVDLLSYRTSDSAVDLVASGGEKVARVAMDLTVRSLQISVPLALLGGSSAIRTAAVVGTFAEATDALPNDGFLESTTAGDAVLLNRDRFAVTVDWKDHTGDVGTGHLAVRAEDSAVFWFFQDDNWELMVKVLDGCGVNQHFWVFSAATTDVEYTLTVTDTSTGTVRTWFNPLGTAAPAITRTDAFDVCS